MNTTQITLWLVRETDAARLYSKLPPDRHPTKDDEVWIPRSVIEHTSKMGSQHICTIADWFVQKAGPVTLDDATQRAAEIVAAIKPFCEPDQCAVAGSVRRGQNIRDRVGGKLVADIDIVATPIIREPDKFFTLREMVNGGKFGKVTKGAFPSRYTQVDTGSYKIDFWWQDKRTYSLNFWIRTGPSEYTARGLSFWKTITQGGYSESAILHLADGTPVPTYTEVAVFDAFDKYSQEAVGKVVGHVYRPIKFLAPDRRR